MRTTIQHIVTSGALMICESKLVLQSASHHVYIALIDCTRILNCWVVSALVKVVQNHELSNQRRASLCCVHDA